MTYLTIKPYIVMGSIFITISTSALAKPVLPAVPFQPSAKGIVVVQPSHRHVKRMPKHRSYHYSKLPHGSAFVFIAGISYVVVDNLYYKRSKDSYIYVEQPPVATSPQVTSIAPTTEATESTIVSTANQTNYGKIVDVLPEPVTTVTVNGATFYVDGGDWYAPIAGTNRFVIVEPQF